jgi:hypothetical protein
VAGREKSVCCFVVPPICLCCQREIESSSFLRRRSRQEGESEPSSRRDLHKGQRYGDGDEAAWCGATRSTHGGCQFRVHVTVRGTRPLHPTSSILHQSGEPSSLHHLPLA